MNRDTSEERLAGLRAQVPRGLLEHDYRIADAIAMIDERDARIAELEELLRVHREATLAQMEDECQESREEHWDYDDW